MTAPRYRRNTAQPDRVTVWSWSLLGALLGLGVAGVVIVILALIDGGAR